MTLAGSDVLAYPGALVGKDVLAGNGAQADKDVLVKASYLVAVDLVRSIGSLRDD